MLNAYDTRTTRRGRPPADKAMPMPTTQPDVLEVKPSLVRCKRCGKDYLPRILAYRGSARHPVVRCPGCGRIDLMPPPRPVK